MSEKRIVITDGSQFKYSLPILWVVDGNEWTKVASFNNEVTATKFRKAMSESYGINIDWFMHGERNDED